VRAAPQGAAVAREWRQEQQYVLHSAAGFKLIALKITFPRQGEGLTFQWTMKGFMVNREGKALTLKIF
jgi:hypothetical protein